ncbi:UvrD-helicase domain-containing protein [Nocardia cyriacigeorgica]|uniref:UvrD-helicase domain-containing protein n=1 Tax=Nocardia cyriacigeorgica TaxID=135487 RepID=UPI003CC7E363
MTIHPPPAAAPPLDTAFDPVGPLPTGTTVLEASAGTGKTYAIVGLAVRYVAEAGIDISQLLLVTFSRAATQELRERTRNRFVGVAAALADPAAARASGDELVEYLAAADEDEVWRRRARLLAALSDFDAGAIATTHSFCQRMLDELGLAGEHDMRSRLVENVDELAETVADDLYLHRYARTAPPFTIKEAHTLALAAVRDRHARLVPDTDDLAGERVAFALAVRAETERRKRLAGLRDFDDLLVLLHEVLTDPEHGPRACLRIRDRFRVALVDEFQDTDPLQWDILRRVFHGHTTMVLVGDPKQAIYAFRGAEVLSYLDAVGHAETRRELTVNWRSDAGLLSAIDQVMGGAALGHDAITVYPVAATRPWGGGGGGGGGGPPPRRGGGGPPGAGAADTPLHVLRVPPPPGGRAACPGPAGTPRPSGCGSCRAPVPDRSTRPVSRRWVGCGPRSPPIWPPISCGCWNPGRPSTRASMRIRDRSTRGISRCWCAPDPRSTLCVKHWTGWGLPRSWRAAPASSRPRVPPTGCG